MGGVLMTPRVEVNIIKGQPLKLMGPLTLRYVKKCASEVHLKVPENLEKA